MNNQSFSDAASNVGDKINNALGDFADDTLRQARGTVDQSVDQVQKAYGTALSETKSFASNQPIMALATAMGVGLILGFALARR
ncbi:conserved hypothetical protein [Methylocella silvestris BL2]|uniref:CsbD family protein n=1 Tax=Methylocella silvestris (strain DSM 15510 / CIP 108128 / LMG 27833 / NCIMB 13906 / BL2) TaxID=395965 RepID=B8EN69_METSB|nr:hypothetical protein [Methylocella silvestris]ACK49582.1 conserved hypothetical protein [Methylocella silvestris BL2]